MKRLLIATATLTVLLLNACDNSVQPTQTRATSSPEDLAAHTQEFRKGVEKVTEGVYVAIGFGLANSIMLEGDDGLIIVDTMETLQEGKTVLKAFRKISDKPIKAIIYTHNHADHVFGSAAFANPGEVPVYAHETTQYYIDRVINVIRPIIMLRSARMFGSRLHGKDLENAGIGPHLGVKDGSVIHALRPSHTFSDKMSVNIAGIEMELIHAPGETNDQLFVWLPKKKVLLPGDNLYRTFPNLYTIRGTAYRDVSAWVDSIDKMRALKPAFVVPSHTRPLSGENEILSILTTYRDAIQFVHDQTVRGINLGMTPDQLVEFVQLPAHLGQSPFLQEFYGKVEWSVRAIFSGYLGWFDGNPSTLLPLSEKAEAQQMIKMAGGEKAMLNNAKEASEQQQYQWVLQITDYLLQLSPHHTEAKQLRINALVTLGQAQSNPNARHYYLTRALELETDFNPTLKAVPDIRFLHSIPVENIFKSMSVSLVAEKTLEMEKAVNFTFPDIDKHFSVTIRRGIAETQAYHQPNADIHITTESWVWKEIIAKIRNPLKAFAAGEITIDGSKLELISFLGLFEAQN